MLEVVQGARLQQGPVWTAADERYYRQQIGYSGADRPDDDNFMFDRLQNEEKSDSDRFGRCVESEETGGKESRDGKHSDDDAGGYLAQRSDERERERERTEEIAVV